MRGAKPTTVEAPRSEMAPQREAACAVVTHASQRSLDKLKHEKRHRKGATRRRRGILPRGGVLVTAAQMTQNGELHR